VLTIYTTRWRHQNSQFSQKNINNINGLTANSFVVFYTLRVVK
jgi:hypothetical protein